MNIFGKIEIRASIQVDVSSSLYSFNGLLGFCMNFHYVVEIIIFVEGNFVTKE